MSSTRRTFLAGAAAIGGAALAGPFLGAISRASAAVVPPPTGPDYVSYQSLANPAGDTLLNVVHKVTGNKILTLPEGDFPIRNFTDPAGFFDGIRIPTTCRGIIGSGRGTVLRLVGGTSTVGSNPQAVGSTAGTTNQCNVIQAANIPNLVLSQFTLRAENQGHNFHGLKITSCLNATLSDLYLKAASRGTGHSPPNETFSIGTNNSDQFKLYRTEVDCTALDNVTRVASSPIGCNNSDDIYFERVYAHHSLSGMVAFWQCSSIHTLRLRSEFNGSGPGSLSGAGINHENCTGSILHEIPTIIIDRAGGNTGLHINLHNGRPGDNPNVSLTGVSHDPGPHSSGAFSVASYLSYKDPYGVQQTQRSFPAVRKNGVQLIGVKSSAISSTPGISASTHFIQYV